MIAADSRPSSPGACGTGKLAWLCLGLTAALCQVIAAADSPAGLEINAAAQERVAQLLQETLGAYRAEAESNGQPQAPLQQLISVEARLREASSLMPERLDLRFGIASAALQQAIQTNSQFDVCVSNALTIYQQIRTLDDRGFEAPLLYAAYTRAVGDSRESDATLRHLLITHPQRTSEYLERFQRIDTVLAMIPNEQPRGDLPNSREHAIVVLGAALETNGVLKAKLVGRLQQALTLARLYPEAPLVLTGGNQAGGITEAYAMSVWLQKEGVSTNRIHLEDRARDTLGNAVYTAAILERLGATYVTLVTSASHLRRGLVDLEEACLQRRLPLIYATLAAREETDVDPCRERLAIYRDAMRASGLWAFPGIKR